MGGAYQKLIEAWDRELNSVELQPLCEDFYAEIKEYLEGLKVMGQEEASGIEGALRRRELERAESLFLDLMKRNAMKIFESLILGGAMPDQSKLTVEEKDAVKHLENFKKTLMEGGSLKPQTEKGIKEGREEGEGKLLLRLLKPLPKITGLDLKNYGPFETEDLATLPASNADPLIKRGIAVRVNWDEGGND